jgi:uncharacterized protein (TIGR03067 family)
VRTTTTFGLIGLVLGVASSTLADDAKDRDALQGTWKLVTFTDRGKSDEADIVAVVNGDRIQFKLADDADPDNLFHFVLDSSVTPKAIDLHKLDAKGQRNEKAIEGLYEIDGDKLRLCVTTQPGPPWNRPAEMKAEEGSVILLVFGRQK